MFNRQRRYIDTSSRFPHYIADWSARQEMELLCPDELIAWREAVAHHYSLPNMGAKLSNRRRLSAAFDRLKSAFFACADCADSSLCVA